jgi:hypothetical protein
MKQFTGVEYLNIDIANNYGHGLDKELWETRINWVERKTIKELYVLAKEADEPVLMIKAIKASVDTMEGKPTGHIMGLDACASGLSIMSVLIGDVVGMRQCGLVDTGARADFYTKMVFQMNQYLPVDKHIDIISNHGLNRADIKAAAMTVLYNSKAEPKKLFGETTEEYKAFYEALGVLASGALELMNDINQFWDHTALSHTFTLPDGHVAYIPVTEAVDKRIEIDELDHATFTHRLKENMPSENGLSLVPNIIHAIDAWIVREMIRKAYYQGFKILTVFDAFYASPNHMNKVRQNYVDIMMDLADSNLMEDILSELAGKKVTFIKREEGVSKYIKDSEYALS